MATDTPIRSLLSGRAGGAALLALALNLLLILLFPPYDYVSFMQGDVPTFEGFRWAFAEHPNRRLNNDFLGLELFALLINFAIAVLLLQRPAPDRPRRSNRAQRWLLAAVGVNLVLMLLFPPFENFIAVSQAALPTFEGFYFVFGDNRQRQIVMPILYLEVTLLLVNGALLWLFLKGKT